MKTMEMLFYAAFDAKEQYKYTLVTTNGKTWISFFPPVKFMEPKRILITLTKFPLSWKETPSFYLVPRTCLCYRCHPRRRLSSTARCRPGPCPGRYLPAPPLAWLRPPRDASALAPLSPVHVVSVSPPALPASSASRRTLPPPSCVVLQQVSPLLHVLRKYIETVKHYTIWVASSSTGAGFRLGAAIWNLEWGNQISSFLQLWLLV